TGRFGPYLKWGKIMATVPKEDRDGTLSLERAVEILAAKAEKGGSGKGKATKSKKSANDDMNTESNDSGKEAKTTKKPAAGKKPAKATPKPKKKA
ncbi:MAG: topoisomerase C-terminal repeat-containing protein, partial [Bdellovibrionales bacterium]